MLAGRSPHRAFFALAVLSCALPCRYVVQEIIKEMAKSRPVGIDGQRGFKVGRRAASVRCVPHKSAPTPLARQLMRAATAWSELTAVLLPLTAPPPPCHPGRCWC